MMKDATKQNSISIEKKRQRSVVFGAKVDVNETLHINDFTPEERDAYWHSQYDYTMIEEMIQITINLLELGGEENDEDGVCFRGVEEITEQGRLLHEQRMNQVLDSVLSTQYFQHTRRFENPDKMALNSDFQSFLPKQLAIAKAQRDEEAIKDYLR